MLITFLVTKLISLGWWQIRVTKMANYVPKILNLSSTISIVKIRHQKSMWPNNIVAWIRRLNSKQGSTDQNRTGPGPKNWEIQGQAGPGPNIFRNRTRTKKILKISDRKAGGPWIPDSKTVWWFKFCFQDFHLFLFFCLCFLNLRAKV